MAETKKEKGLTLTKGETIQLAATLKELHYGSLSSDGAMKLLKNTLSVCKEQDAAEKAQQTIVKGFRTDEYKMLSEKVQQNNATEEEKKKFDSLNRTAMNKINELTDILYNEEVTLEVQKFTDEEFDKIREANKDKVTNGGFVTIYKWLC